MACEDKLTQGKEFQDLNDWGGPSLSDLLSKFSGCENEEVRVYTVRTTQLNKELDKVNHRGSGPNLEGGLATLCTCKHSMRQSHDVDKWKNKWIIGLTSRAKNNGFNGDHYIFYVMRVINAFSSHKELHEHLKLNNPNSLKIKNAEFNRLGDIYTPKVKCTDYLDPMMYKSPCKNHSHGYGPEDDWRHDIVYNNRSAPLLLGDKNNTFVWNKPTIIFNRPRGPGNMKLSIQDLLGYLENRIDN